MSIIKQILHFYCVGYQLFCIRIQTLMSASPTMEVANTTAMTPMEVTHVPAIMGTDLTVMDIFVKVYVK